MEDYIFFHPDGGTCKATADPSRPETWPYLREEITKVYLDCTERFLFTEKDVASPLGKVIPCPFYLDRLSLFLRA